MQPVISVVIPVFDERANLDPLTARLRTTLESAANGSFEVIFVDDGSRERGGTREPAIDNPVHAVVRKATRREGGTRTRRRK